MSNLTSDPNTKTSTLDTTAKLRENINHIEKFGLAPNVIPHIDS